MAQRREDTSSHLLKRQPPSFHRSPWATRQSGMPRVKPSILRAQRTEPPAEAPRSFHLLLRLPFFIFVAVSFPNTLPPSFFCFSSPVDFLSCPIFSPRGVMVECVGWLLLGLIVSFRNRLWGGCLSFSGNRMGGSRGIHGAWGA